MHMTYAESRTGVAAFTQPERDGIVITSWPSETGGPYPRKISLPARPAKHFASKVTDLYINSALFKKRVTPCR